MKRMIGFSGFARNGKSTAAEWLASERNFTRLSFAQPIREMAALLLRFQGMTGEEALATMKDPQTPAPGFCSQTPRHVLQTLGTEWGRECISPDLWNHIAAARIRKIPGPIVFDDVRFPNEADLIRSFGGLIIRIHRDEGGIASGHASEDQAFKSDFEIVNNGSLAHLYTRISEILDGK